MQTPNQQIFCLNCEFSPLEDSTKNIIGYLMKLSERTELSTSNEKRELLQNRMIQSARMTALGELAAGVAHEINNPVHGIISLAEMLRSDLSGNPFLSEDIEHILGEAKRIAKLVKDLMSLAQKDELQFTATDLKMILENSLALVSKNLQRDNINVQLDFATDIPRMMGRTTQLQQVMINLITNSMHALNKKFTNQPNQKEKRIYISLDVQKENKDQQIRITFYDNGIGIPPANIEKIFNPFFTTKQSNEGTGLGLSLTHKIINEHNGSINVTSIEGQYTEMVILLPVLQD